MSYLVGLAIIYATTALATDRGCGTLLTVGAGKHDDWTLARCNQATSRPALMRGTPPSTTLKRIEIHQPEDEETFEDLVGNSVLVNVIATDGSSEVEVTVDGLPVASVGELPVHLLSDRGTNTVTLRKTHVLRAKIKGDTAAAEEVRFHVVAPMAEVEQQEDVFLDYLGLRFHSTAQSNEQVHVLAPQDGEVFLMPTSSLQERADIRFALLYQLHRMHDPSSTWLRLQLDSEVSYEKSLAMDEVVLSGRPLWLGRHQFTQDYLEVGAHVLMAQLVKAHTLEPLGSGAMREFTVRRCDFEWSGDGMREATVGKPATFSAATSCADLAPKMVFTARFHGPSIFVANVTLDGAGSFLGQYTPMESGAHYLMIWVAYYHNSGLGSQGLNRLDWGGRGTYTGSLLVPSFLNATPPVVLVMPSSDSAQPMRKCSPRTEMGGTPIRCMWYTARLASHT